VRYYLSPVAVYTPWSVSPRSGKASAAPASAGRQAGGVKDKAQARPARGRKDSDSDSYSESSDDKDDDGEEDGDVDDGEEDEDEDEEDEEPPKKRRKKALATAATAARTKKKPRKAASLAAAAGDNDEELCGAAEDELDAAGGAEFTNLDEFDDDAEGGLVVDGMGDGGDDAPGVDKGEEGEEDANDEESGDAVVTESASANKVSQTLIDMCYSLARKQVRCSDWCRAPRACN
jgi:hypothetical protein